MDAWGRGVKHGWIGSVRGRQHYSSRLPGSCHSRCHGTQIMLGMSPRPTALLQHSGRTEIASMLLTADATAMCTGQLLQARFRTHFSESQGCKNGSQSHASTTTILQSKFLKMGCNMLGDEYFSRVYHNEFLAWYAQRVIELLSSHPQFRCC